LYLKGASAGDEGYRVLAITGAHKNDSGDLILIARVIWDATLSIYWLSAYDIGGHKSTFIGTTGLANTMPGPTSRKRRGSTLYNRGVVLVSFTLKSHSVQ
jgi:hypothetical protein